MTTIPRKAALLTEVNVGIREVASSSSADGLEWEFFCECGAHNCHETVTLSVEAYTVIHEQGAPVLARGHELTWIGQAKHVRQTASTLRESARALQAQAKHQTARARKHRPPTA